MAFIERLEVRQDNFWLVIGPKGAEIRRLRAMPGINSIQFEARGHPRPASAPLIVRGESREACLSVIEDVNLRIINNSKTSPKFPEVARLYLPEGTTGGRMILKREDVACANDVKVMSRDGRRGMTYFISSIGAASCDDDRGDALADELAGLSVSNNKKLATGLLAYRQSNAVAAFEKALQARRPACSLLQLSVSPGQEIFAAKPTENADAAAPIPKSFVLPIHDGRIFEAELKQHQLRPYFNSFPRASLKESIERRLHQLGYRKKTLGSTSEQPASFTTVHLAAGPERLFASMKFRDTADAKLGSGEKFQHILSVKTNKKKLCSVTQLEARGWDLRISLATYSLGMAGIGDRISEVLSDCWARRSPDGRIAEPAPHTGVKFNMVKHVTSVVYFSRSVVLSGREEVVEVAIKDMQLKEAGERQWHHCLEVDLKMPTVDIEKQSAQQLVNICELLRDSWQELAV